MQWSTDEKFTQGNHQIGNPVSGNNDEETRLLAAALSLKQHSDSQQPSLTKNQNSQFGALAADRLFLNNRNKNHLSSQSALLSQQLPEDAATLAYVRAASLEAQIYQAIQLQQQFPPQQAMESLFLSQIADEQRFAAQYKPDMYLGHGFVPRSMNTSSLTPQQVGLMENQEQAREAQMRLVQQQYLQHQQVNNDFSLLNSYLSLDCNQQSLFDKQSTSSNSSRKKLSIDANSLSGHLHQAASQEKIKLKTYCNLDNEEDANVANTERKNRTSLSNPMMQDSNEKISISGDVPTGICTVPCRARGMSMDHNFKTAYFIIPDTIKHGDELKCSYEPCQKSGVKFRFCTHCKIPVAKRNFRKRHKHGMPDFDSIASDDEKMNSGIINSSDVEVKSDCSNTGDYVQSLNVLDAKNQSSSMPTKTDDLVSSSDNENQPPAKKLPCKLKETIIPVHSNMNTCVSSTEAKVNSPNTNLRRAELWAKLLSERPLTENNDLMSAWLLKVLSVSDFTKPLSDDVSKEFMDLNKKECTSPTKLLAEEELTRSKPVKKRNKVIDIYYPEDKEQNYKKKGKFNHIPKTSPKS